MGVWRMRGRLAHSRAFKVVAGGDMSAVAKVRIDRFVRETTANLEYIARTCAVVHTIDPPDLPKRDRFPHIRTQMSNKTIAVPRHKERVRTERVLG
ncbi:hypothetical protein EIP86_009427 [Pleurotus ostreatoroseus]|nr:hypothetical protein EIP86_009427 [Pleurotus ostreatoroseus]